MLIQGADGVFIGGCHLGDCHYIKGNYYAEKRYHMTKKLLARTGLNPERLQLKWISASEGQLFADTMREVTELIRELGPSPVAGDKPDLDILEQLLIIRNAAEDYRLRVLIGKGISLMDEYNVYNEQLDSERYQALLDEAIDEEYIRSGILFYTREEPQAVPYLATKINVSPELVLKHVVTLKDRDLIRMERIDDDTPYYISQVHSSMEEEACEETNAVDQVPEQPTEQTPPPASEPVPTPAPIPAPAPAPTPSTEPTTNTEPTGGE
jgi:hypothetical protein